VFSVLVAIQATDKLVQGKAIDKYPQLLCFEFYPIAICSSCGFLAHCVIQCQEYHVSEERVARIDFFMIILCLYRNEEFKVDLEGDFKPTLINSAIYLLSLSMQVSTFAANYQGEPFREGLWENKPMRNGLLAVFGIAFLCATEVFPEINEQLQIVPLPELFRDRLVFIMAIDFGLCFVIEIVTKYLFARSEPKAILGLERRKLRQVSAEEAKKLQ
jgi:hypothetical protein